MNNNEDIYTSILHLQQLEYVQHILVTPKTRHEYAIRYPLFISDKLLALTPTENLSLHMLDNEILVKYNFNLQK